MNPNMMMMRLARTRRGDRRVDQGGFTLIELLVVVVILGILAGVVVFAVRGAGGKGSSEALATDERIIRTALEAYCAQNSHYPQADPPRDAMQVLVDAKFLSDRSTLHGLETSTDSTLPQGNCNGEHYNLTGGKPPTGNPTATCTTPYEGWCTIPGSLDALTGRGSYNRALALPSGKVLFNATQYGGGSLVLYDPSADPAALPNGAWTSVGSPSYNPPAPGVGSNAAYVESMILIGGNRSPECPHCGKVLVLPAGTQSSVTKTATPYQLFDPLAPLESAWSVAQSSPEGVGNGYREGVQISGTNCFPLCDDILLDPANGNAGNSAQLYDPHNNTVTPVGNPGDIGYGSILAALPDGRVLADSSSDPTGKKTSPDLNSVKLFDPASKPPRFVDAPAPHLFHDYRHNKPAIALPGPGGAVLVNAREIYTPESPGGPVGGSWDVVTSCAGGDCHVLTSLADGTVMAAHGDPNFSGEIFLFDASRTWRQTGSLANVDSFGAMAAALLTGTRCEPAAEGAPPPNCGKVLEVGLGAISGSHNSGNPQLYTPPLCVTNKSVC